MGRQSCWGVKNGVAMAAMAVVVVVLGALSVGAAGRPLQVIRVPGGEADELCGKTERKNGFREDDSESDGGDHAAAVFVMGASYMDVGENFAAMPFRTSADFAPYGMDYFGAPTGRHSNGRLIIDHISQGLGHGLLSPYLRNAGASFQHGVNFASSGSRACNSSVQGDGSDSSGLFSLSVQVDQFRVFHQEAVSMYKTKKGLLPTPMAFSRGVYIIESGNNDYNGVSLDQFDAMTTLVLESIEQAIRSLYNEGARTIVVMDAFPIACFPLVLWNADPKELNQDGCVSPFAKAIEHYNSRLGVMVVNLNPQLAGANLILFSLHGVFMTAIRNPSKFGLKYVHKACCGYGGGDYNFNDIVLCGRDGIVDGELRKATVCENRSEYMLWDKLHPTEAFAFHIAQAFLKGEHMQPPFYIKETRRHAQ